METKATGLCHRCDWRAQHRETGRQPRMECGSSGAVYSCYMYRPVLPAITDANSGDNRPRFSGFMISARERYVGVPERDELWLKVQDLPQGQVLLYYVPTKTQRAQKAKTERQHQKQTQKWIKALTKARK